MSVTQVILDVDTGVDDALAIMFAVRHPGLQVRAISCVAGNAAVDQVVVNTLSVLDHLDAPQIPVGRGAARPLLNAAHDARHVHGADGLGDLGLPSPRRSASTLGAIELMREQILDSADPVTLVPLAPMTNVALLLRTYPEVVDNIDRIVFMGGSASSGNASAVAEFNVWHDPEAAAIVLGTEVALTMYGLDVFYAVAVGPDAYEPLTTHPDPAVQLAGRLLAHSHEVVRGDPRVADGGLLGDAGAVCAVADRSRLTTQLLPVRVEVAPGLCRGQTVVDRRVLAGEDSAHGLEQPARQVDVAIGTDAEFYRDLFLDTVVR